MSDTNMVPTPEEAQDAAVNVAEPVADSAAVLPPVDPSETDKSKEIEMAEVVTFEKFIPGAEKAATDAVAQVKAGYEEFQVKMQSMMEKQMKSMADVTEFTKGNVEAMIESAKAATSGAEVLATQFVETSKAAVEEAQTAFKSFATAKTPNELIQQQNDFAKAQFDKVVANWSKATETWMKVAGEVVQPLSNRMALAAETVKKSVA